MFSKLAIEVLRFYPPNLRNKLNPPYIGPYLVIGKPGAVTYSLQSMPAARTIFVHTDHLKKYHGHNIPVSWVQTLEQKPKTGNVFVSPVIVGQADNEDPKSADLPAVGLEDQTGGLTTSPDGSSNSKDHGVGVAPVGCGSTLAARGNESADEAIPPARISKRLR